MAVYPHTATISGNTITFDLPAEQNLAAPGSFADDANPMMGTFSDPNNLSFTSLCGGLGLQLTGDNIAITAIEIVSNTATEKLYGLFEADCTAANPVLTPATGNSGTNSVRLNCTTTLTTTAQSFFIVLPVGTLADGFTMNVYGEGTDPIFSTSTNNAITIVLNQVNQMPTVEVAAAPAVGPLTTPLTFEAREDGVIIYIYNNSTSLVPNLQYSQNSGEWTDYTDAITLTNVGDIVSFRENNLNFCEAKFHCGSCYIYGNVMSLLHAEDYATNYELSEAAFKFLFNGCYIDIHPEKDLVLPATTLANECYYGMFDDCWYLTTPPALPATTLAEYCYYAMFADCDRLTVAPELNAETLAVGCYSFMFFDCRFLASAPSLPAKTLVDECYSYMFYSCSRLSSVTCMATDISATECTTDWLVYAGTKVTGTKTFTTPSTTNWSSDTSGIPSGWTRVDAE